MPIRIYFKLHHFGNDTKNILRVDKKYIAYGQKIYLFQFQMFIKEKKTNYTQHLVDGKYIKTVCTLLKVLYSKIYLGGKIVLW